MDDKIVPLGANPLRDKVLAAMDKLPSSGQKKAISTWRRGFFVLGSIGLLAFTAWVAADISYQQAEATASTHYKQELNTQAAQHQATMATLKTEHNNTLASEIKTWQANVANVRTESTARIKKARQRLAQVEQKAAAEKAATNQRIRDLIKVNEQFKTYYETPAHERAVDIVWPERLQQPTSATGSNTQSEAGQDGSS